MSVLRLTGAYFFWHYTRALFNIVTIWRNFLWFVFHFFSIPTLTRTLFTPWRRLGEEYGGNFDIKEYATVLVVNALMRTIGAIFRLFVILLGLAGLAVVFILGAVFGAVWLLMPLVVAGLLSVGGVYLI